MNIRLTPKKFNEILPLTSLGHRYSISWRKSYWYRFYF